MYVLYNVQIIVSQFQSLSTYLFVWHLIFDIQYYSRRDVRAVLSWAALPPKSRHRFAMFIAVLSILCPAPAWFGWCSAQCLAPVTADNTIRSEPEPASAELVQTDTAVPEHSGKIADSLVFILFICITRLTYFELRPKDPEQHLSADFIFTISNDSATATDTRQWVARLPVWWRPRGEEWSWQPAVGPWQRLSVVSRESESTCHVSSQLRSPTCPVPRREKP